MKRISEYLKMRILAAIEVAEGKTIRDRIRAVASKTHLDESGRACVFTWRTIETWRVRYMKNGWTTCKPGGRSDKGKLRKVFPEEVQSAIEQAMTCLRPACSQAELYRTCITKGFLQRNKVSPTSFKRIIRAYDLLKPIALDEESKRLAFSKPHANDLWQADTLFGSLVKNPKGEYKQTKLIAFIDDASRVVCHGQFFFEENLHALKTALRAAFYKRGLPKALYFDNGSIYSSKDMILVCARLGVLLCHTQVRDAAAKGKIERFFRTVRETFLIRQLDLSSLDELNRQFTMWAENEYNCRLHSTLGMKPIDRFALDLPRLRWLSPNSANDEMFLCEETRQVKADNTFSFDGTRYEAPRDLRNREVTVRFDKPHEKGAPLPLYYKNERMGTARPVNFIANDRPPQPRL